MKNALYKKVKLCVSNASQAMHFTIPINVLNVRVWLLIVKSAIMVISNIIFQVYNIFS